MFGNNSSELYWSMENIELNIEKVSIQITFHIAEAVSLFYCMNAYAMPIFTIHFFHIHACWCHGSSASVYSVVMSKAIQSVILHVVIELRIPLLVWLPFICLLLLKYVIAVWTMLCLCVCVCVWLCLNRLLSNHVKYILLYLYICNYWNIVVMNALIYIIHIIDSLLVNLE